jgi:hypothetical protein
MPLPVATHGRATACWPKLEKPFDPDALADRLAEVTGTQLQPRAVGTDIHNDRYRT